MVEEKSFIWNPEEYSQSSSSQYLWANELLSKINLTGRENILDIGCGDGRITAQIAKVVPNGKVIGIDSSKEMINYARKTFSTGDNANLKFVVMDAESIQLSEKCDLAFSNAALHWVENHKKVLDGVANVLKPNGRLIISCGGKGNAVDVLKIVNALADSAKWKNYFPENFNPYHFYGTDEYAVWLKETGFSYSNLELVPKDMQHKNIDEFVAWIRTTWLPYTQRIPEVLREEFIRETVETYMKFVPPDAAGVVHVKMIRLEVDAVKN